MAWYESIQPEHIKASFWGTFLSWSVMGILLFGIWGCPYVQVHYATQDGRGLLQKAQFTRQIAREDSLARVITAQADSVAEATLAGGFESGAHYLTYLFIEAIRESQCAIAYLPNDGTLPVTEALRLASPDIQGPQQDSED